MAEDVMAATTVETETGAPAEQKLPEPSQEFIDLVTWAYREESRRRYPTTPAGLYERMYGRMLQEKSFSRMFAWDNTGGGAGKDRVETVTKAIQQGFIPDLAVVTNDRGRLMVVDTIPF